MGYYAIREKLHAIYALANVDPPRQPWHALRHSFCTNLAAAGVPVHQVKRLAGHKSIETTMRYMHASETELAAAISKSFGSRVGPESQPKSRKLHKV